MEVEPAYEVDQTKAGGDRPASVDPSELVGRDFSALTGEMESSQMDLQSPEEHRHEGPELGAGESHSQGMKHHIKYAKPLVDIAAGQELGRGLASQIKRLVLGRRRGRGEKLGRGLRTAAGICQGVSQLRAQTTFLGQAHFPKIEGACSNLTSRSNASDWTARAAAIP